MSVEKSSLEYMTEKTNNKCENGRNRTLWWKKFTMDLLEFTKIVKIHKKWQKDSKKM